MSLLPPKTLKAGKNIVLALTIKESLVIYNMTSFEGFTTASVARQISSWNSKEAKDPLNKDGHMDSSICGGGWEEEALNAV